MGRPHKIDAWRPLVQRSATVLFAAFVTACHFVPPDMVAQPTTVAQSPGNSRFKNDTISVALVARPSPSAGEVWEALNGKPLVSAASFQQAVVDSLRNASLFADVLRGTADATKTGGARYLLNAEIVKQDRGGYGATVEVRYTLIDTAAGHPLWSDDLTSSYRYPATVSAFFTPAHTDTEALWHAFRQNMELMMSKIANLP